MEVQALLKPRCEVVQHGGFTVADDGVVEVPQEECPANLQPVQLLRR